MKLYNLLSAAAVQIDERTKKVLLVFLALFIIVLLIFGLIYSLIHAYMEKHKKDLDYYMFDYMYKVVNDSKDFMKVVRYHERRKLFRDSVGWITAAIVLTVGTILATKFFFEADYANIFSEFFKLFPRVKFQTVKMINDALEASGAIGGDIAKINLPGWMPVSIIPSFISKNPDFSSITLWVSTVYYVGAIVCFFGILGAILAFIARYRRAVEKKVSAFNKDLDKVDPNRNLDNL